MDTTESSAGLSVQSPATGKHKTVDISPHTPVPSTPEVHLNGKPASIRASTMSASPSSQPGDDGWGSNFWVTLVDPQVCHCTLISLFRLVVLRVFFLGRSVGRLVPLSHPPSVDSSIILRVSFDRRSKLGPSGWKLPVCDMICRCVSLFT